MQVNQPANLMTTIRDLQRQIDEIRKRVGLTSATVSKGGLTVQDGGDLKLRDGGRVLIYDNDDNVIMELGQSSLDGRIGMLVNNAGGDPQLRAGELESSTGYGLEAVDGAGELVTLESLAFGLVTAQVAATETRTSTSFGDLTTGGPSVTVEIGTSGRAFVFLSGILNVLLTSGGAEIGYAVSGATTVAPSVSGKTVALYGAPGAALSGTRAVLQTGLNPGSNTFTCKYKAINGTETAQFSYRNIAVMPF